MIIYTNLEKKKSPIRLAELSYLKAPCSRRHMNEEVSNW